MDRRSFKKGGTRLTKNQMARVYICALYNMVELPAADDSRVTKQVRINKRDELVCLHGKALAVINAERAR